jgi:hypothetical protein
MRICFIVLSLLAVSEASAGTLNWKKLTTDQQGVTQYLKQDTSSVYVTNHVFVRLNQGVDVHLFAARHGFTVKQQFEDGLILFDVGNADVVQQYSQLLHDTDVQNTFLDMVQKVRLR